MRTLIVTTDFTESSRNALAYACALAANHDYRLLLLHIYTMPVTYTSDGVALTAITEAMDRAEQQLEDEADWARAQYAGANIELNALTGGFIATLREEVKTERPDIIIMGAPHDFTDLWAWDSELLDAVTTLPAPVLLVPRYAVFAPIANIGFACDYRNLCAPGQTGFVKWVVNYFNAKLHVVHITRAKPPQENVKQKNEALLHHMLREVAPVYYTIDNPDVIESVTGFVKERQIDLLIVIPHRQNTWNRLFHQGHTKQLARLNHIPILALHD